MHSPSANPARGRSSGRSTGHHGPGRLQAWAAILTTIWRGWGMRIAWPLRLVIAMPFVALLGWSYWSLGPRWVWIMLVVIAWLLVLAAWGGLVHGLIAQNTPSAARCVPGHLRRLRELIGLGWCTAILAMAGIAVLSGKGMVLYVGLLSGPMLLATALGVRWPLVFVALWAWPALLRQVLGKDAGLLVDFELTGPLLVAVGLLTLLIGWMLGGLLGGGGGRHLRRHARAAAWRRAIWTGHLASEVIGGAWVRLSRVIFAPYHARFESLGRSNALPVWPRLLLVFGPRADWRVHAFCAGGIIVLGVPVFGWLMVRNSGSLWTVPLDLWDIAAPAVLVSSLVLNPLTELLKASASTRREQALVSLLPGVPRGAALNRGLALRALWYFIGAWFVVVVLQAAMTAALAPQAWPPLLAALIGLWPAAAQCFTDLSRLPVRPTGRLVLTMAIFTGGVLSGLAAHRLGLPLWLLAVASGLLTAALLARGWRRLGRLPSALPACRLA